MQCLLRRQAKPGGGKSISVPRNQNRFSSETGAVGYGENFSMENPPFDRVARFP